MNSISQRSVSNTEGRLRSDSLQAGTSMKQQQSETSLDQELFEHVRIAQPQFESNHTVSGSQLGIMSNKNYPLVRGDWRKFFGEQELDSAF